MVFCKQRCLNIGNVKLLTFSSNQRKLKLGLKYRQCDWLSFYYDVIWIKNKASEKKTETNLIEDSPLSEHPYVYFNRLPSNKLEQ